MNLVIISTGNYSDINNRDFKRSDQKIMIEGEYLIERIIKIGRNNGIKKVFCLINSHEVELKNYLSIKNFGIPVKLFVEDKENSLHSLFVAAPFLMKEPFFLVTMDLFFLENEFSEFITYSLLQEYIDGVLAVTKFNHEKENPICVAMNDEEVILKFSDSKDGYSWAVGGIYYFSPNVFDEMEYVLQAGISSLSKALQLLIVKGYILKGFSFSKIINLGNVTDIVKVKEIIRGNE